MKNENVSWDISEILTQARKDTLEKEFVANRRYFVNAWNAYRVNLLRFRVECDQDEKNLVWEEIADFVSTLHRKQLLIYRDLGGRIVDDFREYVFAKIKKYLAGLTDGDLEEIKSAVLQRLDSM
jgi:hypothetical protein